MAQAPTPAPTPGPPLPPPPPPLPPPKPASGPTACVDPSPSSFKASPVFVQRVTGSRRGDQTFPAARCLPCRFDQLGVCSSAMVICPAAPGGPVIEKTWRASDSCRGDPDRVAALTSDFAMCPGPQHYSPTTLVSAIFHSALNIGPSVILFGLCKAVACLFVSHGSRYM